MTDTGDRRATGWRRAWAAIVGRGPRPHGPGPHGAVRRRLVAALARAAPLAVVRPGSTARGGGRPAACAATRGRAGACRRAATPASSAARCLRRPPTARRRSSCPPDGWTAIGDVDHLSGQVTAGAGATLGDVRRHAAAAGWSYGVDLAARDSATIGGTVATNAGGIHVIAYGMTRAQVVGIEAVLPDGTVVSHLSGLLKDNTGYDLGALLCGSEGTLGGHHRGARCACTGRRAARRVALIGCASYAEALELMASAVAPGSGCSPPRSSTRRAWTSPADRDGRAAGRWQRRHPVVVLLEVVDGGDASGLVGLDDADVVVGLDAAEQARLWAFRERAGRGVLVPRASTHKLDVSVPLPVLAACADELERPRRRPYPAVADLRGVRPPGRRQHPRRDLRPRRGRPGRRPRGAGVRGALRRLDLGRARRRAGQGRASCTCAARPRRSPRCGRSRRPGTRRG